MHNNYNKSVPSAFNTQFLPKESNFLMLFLHVVVAFHFQNWFLIDNTFSDTTTANTRVVTAYKLQHKNHILKLVHQQLVQL